jgi:hypothetical protein
MPTRPQLLIAFAVQRCLEQCLASRAPLACMADFLYELEDREWSRDDIQEVERRVVIQLYDKLSQER